MAGRPKSKLYKELSYELVKVENKHAAYCTICKKHLFNTAGNRLRAHRNVCKIVRSKESDDADSLKLSESNVIYLDHSTDEAVLLKTKDPTIFELHSDSERVSIQNYFTTKTPTELVSTPEPNTSTSCDSSSDHNSPRKKRKRPKSKFNSIVDQLSPKEEREISLALAEFFYGCGIPLSIVESIHFKNFIKKVRPSYVDKIPSREVLSTKLLDNVYEKCLYSAKASLSAESVLLIDVCKNSSTNSKTVVSMIHNANGEHAFLDAWDLTGKNETAKKLEEIVKKSVDLAKEIYSTHVYAIVMRKMGYITADFIWKSNCSSHIANLLAKDVLNKELNTKVISILKEFKNSDLEQKIVDEGGSRIKLPCESRWCSYRDAFKCFIQNFQLMMVAAADFKIKENIAFLLLDSQLIDEVKCNIELLDPICNIISKCQSANCSVAESANMWMDLQLPEEFSEQLKLRKNMALNKYALSAFYLHPFMDKSKLSNESNEIIFDFLFETLNANGLEEWIQFRNKQGFFQKLYEKEIQNPLVFWNIAEIKFPNLAQLALKLLQIPASTLQIERFFSNWSHEHCPSRNRLTIERSNKLLHLFYTLRIKDVSQEEDYETE